jgi:enoyl-CoA hydratase
MPQIIGHGLFRELALTGRNFTAAEAPEMGFVTHVCGDRDSLYEEAGKLAAEIAACPPLAVQGTKDAIIYSRDNGIGAGLAYTAQKSVTLLWCEDMMEAIAAFRERRPPDFKGK